MFSNGSYSASSEVEPIAGMFVHRFMDLQWLPIETISSAPDGAINEIMAEVAQTATQSIVPGTNSLTHYIYTCKMIY